MLLTSNINEAEHSQYWGALQTFFLTILVIFLSYIFQIIIYFFVPEFRAIQPVNSVSDVSGSSQAVNGFRWSIITCATATVYILSVISLIKIRRKNLNVADYLKLQALPVPEIMQWIGVWFALMLFLSLLSFVVGRPYIHDYFISGYKTANSIILFWIAVALIGPVAEEVLFRGFLLEGLRNSKLGVTGAILISSVIWTMIHFQYDKYDLTQLFIMGVLLGLAKIHTKSLYTPIIIHSLSNFGVLIHSAYYVRILG